MVGAGPFSRQWPLLPARVAPFDIPLCLFAVCSNFGFLTEKHAVYPFAVGDSYRVPNPKKQKDARYDAVEN